MGAGFLWPYVSYRLWKEYDNKNEEIPLFIPGYSAENDPEHLVNYQGTPMGFDVVCRIGYDQVSRDIEVGVIHKLTNSKMRYPYWVNSKDHEKNEEKNNEKNEDYENRKP